MLANFAIGDVAIDEGNAATTDLRFTVTLAEPNGSQVTVNYETAPGTALSGGADTDFVAKSGTLTFPIGVTTQFIDVAINGDLKVEGNENFTVTLSNPSGGATISDGSATGTITNDDAAQVKIGHLPVNEGNTNRDIEFIITLSNPVDVPVTVDYTTFAITASDTGPDRDYIPETGVITFAAGDTLERIPVTIIGDTVPEPNESFEFRMSNIQSSPARNVTFENTAGTATLFNDEGTPPAPTLTINDVTETEGHAGTRNFEFTVTLANHPGGAPVLVNYTTQDQTATAADNDYEAANGTLSFFAGTTTQTVNVTVNGDTMVEAGTEIFHIVLANASIGVTIGDDTGVGTITDDDAAEITISDATQVEGNSGQSTFSFRVALSNPVDVAVSGSFTTQDGTAEDQIGNNDYISESGTFAFAPGVTETFIVVDVNGDTAIESTENFSVVLSNLQVTPTRNVTLTDATGVGTITSDDVGLTAALSINDVTQAESNENYVFTLSLSAPVANQVCVDVTTPAGTSNVCIPALSTSATVSVNRPNDNIVEEDETFQVTLGTVTEGGSQVTITDGTGVGTTQDDDTATITIDDPSVAEGNAGDATLTFTVTLSNPVSEDVTITFNTLNGAAQDQTGDNDYQSQSSAVTIPANSLSGTINVAVHGDMKVELNETLNVQLGVLSAGGFEGDEVNIVDSLGLGIITNDDQATLSIDDVEQAESIEDYEFTLTLSQPVDTPITVDVMTDLDTTPITFAAGETTQTVVVNVPDNDIVEFDGEFDVTLTNLQANNRNVVIGDGMGMGTILDDDTATISINDVSQMEDMEDYEFTITLSQAVDTLVCVEVATDLDMTDICFDPLETSTTFTVNVPDNDIVEFDGFFDVTLSNVDAGGLPVTILDGMGEGEILDDDTADVTIADAMIVEGNSGESMLVFTVTLSQQVDAVVTVTANTGGGDATAGTDYTALTNTTITFPALSTSQTVSVPIQGDTATEPDETFILTLSNLLAEGLEGVAVAITDATATGTITNDDVGPALSINDVSLVEGNTGTTNLVFTVTLANADPQATVTVNVSTVDGTATVADNDYAAIASQAITFAPGETTQQVIVSITGDNRVEADETLTATLSGATGAIIADATGEGTVTNDDAATISIADAAPDPEGNAGSLDGIPFTITLSNPVDVSVTVVVNTADGTATIANNDYLGVTNRVVTFAPGVVTMSISVDVMGDIMPEANETFTVNLTDPQASGRTVTLGDASATGTIENDDIEQPILVVGDTTVVEGDAGATMLTFTVTLMFPATSGSVTVNYATQDGTATIADDDYESATGSLTLSSTSPTATVQMTINGDTKVEADETLQLMLSGAVGAVIGDATGTGTITNDDDAVVSIADVTLAEGTAGTPTAMNFTVSLSQALTSDVTVTLNTANGTATLADTDYTALTNQMVTIPAGQTSVPVTVNLSADNRVELDENFTVALSNLLVGGTPQPAATLGDATATGTITNDDTATISINDVTQAENIEDYTFTITMSRPVDVAVTLDAMTDLGSMPITFAPGETTQTVLVTVDDNDVVETDGVFMVDLVNLQASGRAVTIADGEGVGTIEDDDTATLSINNVSQAESVEDFVFTLTLSKMVDAQVCVDVSTDLDETQICFAPLDTTETFTVNIPDNDDVDPDFVFDVLLDNLMAAGLPVTIADAMGEGEGLDDDTAVVSIDNVSVTEGNTGEVDMTFTLTLSNPASETVTLTYMTVEGTAEDETGDNDFHSATGTVTFAPLQTTATIVLDAHGDTDIEPNETYTVQLSNIVDGDIRPGAITLSTTAGTGTGTILNDDSPTLSIGDATIVEGNSATSNLQFTVTLSAAAATDVTFDIATANGTAMSTDSDFTAVATTPLTIPAGQTTRTFNVVITGDMKVETTENFTVTISNAMNATILDGSATGTITNDDMATISIADAAVTEGNTGPAAMTFNVTLSNPVDRAVTITVNTANGTATVADNDYTAVTAGTVTIAAGQTTGTVTVNATGDTRLEANENFTVTLSAPLAGGVADTNITLLDATATGTINNDDTTTISIADASVTEGNTGSAAMTFTVTLSSALEQALTLTVNTTDGTATVADSDYTAVSAGTLTIPAGQTTGTVTVNATGDTRVEANETLTVTLTNPLVGGVANAGVTLLDATATGTINNDDIASLSIGDLTLNEGTGATPTSFTFTITSTNTSSQPITVLVNTADGTATVAGADYTALTGQTVTIAAGQTTATVTVNVTADSTVEPNENFTVTLSNAQIGGATDTTRVTIGDATATATITNDDFAATSSLAGAVFVDANANGVRDANEPGIPGVTVTLSGTDSSSATVNRTMLTANDGSFSFGQLSPGTYTVTETQPPAFIDGTETAGTSGGTVGNDAISAITLAGDANATGYTFSERGLLPQFVSKRLFLSSSPDTDDMLRELNARSEEMAGNQARADAIRAGGDDGGQAARTLSIADATITEGDSGTTTLNFNVTMSAASDVPVSFTVNTTNGSAISGQDYVAVAAQTVTLNPGETARNVSVTINGDTTVEAAENFTVTLSNIQASGRTVTFADATATGTINNNDSANFSINDVAATNEGNTGSTNFPFTVTMTGTVDVPVTVSVNTGGGTATAGTDYTAITAQTLTFSPGGAVTQTVNVSVTGDTTNEPDETFNVTLSDVQSGGRNVTLGDATGTGTIRNDDATGPTLSIADATITEGNTGSSNLNFTVTLSQAASSTVTVNAATSNVTTSANDFTPITSQVVTFNAGETSKQVTVAITGDTTVEQAETFTVTLSGATGATISDASATGLINNDDTATFSINDVTLAEGNTGTTQFPFVVTLTGTVDVPVTVTVNTGDGTAMAGTGTGADYTAIAGQVLTFNPGAAATQTVNVAVNGDTTNETNETFNVTLSNVQASGRTGVTIADATGVGTINNDDTTGQSALSITDATVAEPNTATTTVTFNVNLSVPATAPVTVNVATSNGTTSADDFTAITSQAVNFAVGETTKPVSVTITGDTRVELDETFTVTLSGATGATIEDATATGTITNNDTASFAINDVTQNEGNSGTSTFSFTVTMTGTADTPVMLTVNTGGGNATAGTDYTTISGQIITFPAGAATQPVTVTVQGDTTSEPDETFNVTLSNVQAGGRTSITISDATGVGTITNDDGSAVAGLSIADASLTEPNTGFTTPLPFTITLSPAATGPVTVLVSTSNGSATTADNDYTAVTAQQVSFATGESSQTINIQITGDNKVEADETFTVTLSSPSGASIGTATATGRIINNDSATLSIADATPELEGGIGSMDGNPFAITLSNPVDTEVRVTVNTQPDTASPADYTPVINREVIFLAGTTTQSTSVDVIGDTIDEQNETYNVLLSNVQASGRSVTVLDGTAIGTITDDDPASQAGALVQTVDEFGNVTTIASAETSTTLHASRGDSSSAHDAALSDWIDDSSSAAHDDLFGGVESWLTQ